MYASIHRFVFSVLARRRGRSVVVDQPPLSVDAPEQVGRLHASGVVFLFPGGGAQYVGMARGLHESEPVFRRTLDECFSILETKHQLALRRLVFPASGDEAAAAEKLQQATSLEEASELLIQLNDIVINDRAVIPEVNRSADTYAISNRLRKENIALGVGFEYNYWNIANWNTVEG